MRENQAKQGKKESPLRGIKPLNFPKEAVSLKPYTNNIEQITKKDQKYALCFRSIQQALTYRITGI